MRPKRSSSTSAAIVGSTPNRARAQENGNRRVMGRKGIGKLAPFGICRRIEVVSSGGDPTPDGYLTTHFHIDYDAIMTDEEGPVLLDAGDLDNTYQPERGTAVRLTNFLPKRVPPLETFRRQVARRFAFAERAAIP